MTAELLLVSLAQQQPALLLVDYLKQHGIECQYRFEAGDRPHGILLLDQEKTEQAQAIVRQFVADPNNPKFASAAWRNAESVNIPWGGSGQRQRAKIALSAAPFTTLILGFCVVIFALAWLRLWPQIYDLLRFAPFGQMADSFQWYRIWGPALLHFSLLHIIFNLMWWWVLGRQIEQHLGSSSLIILFLIIAAVSNIGQYLASGVNFGGLSGVVYGVMGFVWYMGHLRPRWGMFLPRAIAGFMLLWLALGYTDVLGIAMANTAHLLGLISGLALAWIWHHIAPMSGSE